MTADDIKSAAWIGKEPSDMLVYEKLYYERMVRIYELFRKGLMSEEKAVAGTNHALKEYENYARMAEAERQRSMHTAAFFKNIELTASRYRKDRTIENADSLIEAIDEMELMK